MNRVTSEMKIRMHELSKQGMSNACIARELNASHQTVRYYLNPRCKELQNKWYKEHRGWYNNYRNNQNRRQRLKLITMLGSKCAECNNNDPRVLQLNHIQGGGNKERRKLGSHGLGLYRSILRGERTTEDLNLLCVNCDILHSYKIGVRSWIGLDRLRVITLLGGKCARCGISDARILQINHVDGGGIKEYGNGKNQEFYSSIVQGERTTDDLNLLCGNCNLLYEYEVGRRGNTARNPVPGISFHVSKIKSFDSLRAKISRR